MQTPEQQKKYLLPLLRGEIRSSFAMTEKGVSSSDAKNISGSIKLEGDEIVLNAHKQWISGAGDPRNGVHVCLLHSPFLLRLIIVIRSSLVKGD